MKIFAALFLFISFNALALETDNYIIWGRELKDSRNVLNQFFTDHILQVVKASPHKSCDEITETIAKGLRSFGVHDNPVENFLVGVLKDNEIYPRNFDYNKQSIYRDPYYFYLPSFGLSPNIQVNGYYFGTDKLSHFASTGNTYFRLYRFFMERNFSDSEAREKAIDYGVTDEKTLHGYFASGVFSYADLEANYQGFLFYKKLCSDKDNYLEKGRNGYWKLRHAPDMANYVSGNWDESYLNSYLLPGNWKKASRVIKALYCSKRSDQSVLDREVYYEKNNQPSFSMEYIDQLIKDGKAPDPRKDQALNELCFRG